MITKKCGDYRVELPIKYDDAFSFQAIFPARTRPVRSMIPVSCLEPVEIAPGWSAVGIAFFEYVKTSIGPYYEAAVAFPVRYRPMFNPPLIPMLFETKLKDLGMWIHRLPVTTEIALRAGIDIWGYPKFIGDIAIEKQGDCVVGRLSEGKRNILSLDVNTSIKTKPFRTRVSTYTRLRKDILRTTISMNGEGAMKMALPKAKLTLGEHDYGQELLPLGIATGRPLQVRYYPMLRSILPEAGVVYKGEG